MTSTTTIIRITGREESMPGPGAYDQDSKFGKEGRAVTFRPSSERSKDRTEPNPQYQNIGSTIGTGHKYSFRSRPKDPPSTQSPGPNYVPPSFGKDARGTSFHMRRDETKKRDVTPGPGEYQIPSTIQAKNGISLKSRAFPPSENGKNESPGPAYNPKYDYLYHVNGVHFPAKDQNSITQKRKKAVTPGPGEYTIPSSLSKKGSSFHGRNDPPAHQESTPGPGQYDCSNKTGSDLPKYSIRPKTSIHNDINPKAGKVYPKYEAIPSTIGQGPKVSFGPKMERAQTAPESKRRNTNDNPPGPSYMPPAFGSDCKGGSFHSRHEKRKTADETPGPGAYVVESAIGKGRKFTFKGRDRSDKIDKDIPGPAAYYPNYKSVIENKHDIVIHDVIHKKEKVEAAPQYVNLPSTLNDAPKITIGRREAIRIVSGAD